MHISVFLFLILLSLGPAFAIEPDEILADPKLEARARSISAELRCVVCQNQSIDDSDAPLARDLRILVRERLKQGDSDEGVVDFIVARYGQFVLLKPPVSPSTLLLWLAPILLAGSGVLYLVFARRPRVGAAAPAPLSEAEIKKIDQLLEK